jgi:hypothetical protein
VRLVVLNHDLVANLHLASATTQLHITVADIESMRKMDIFTPGDPDSYWYDRFGSRRLPFAFAKSRHVPASLRVAVLGFFVIVIFFLAFIFVFILIWLLSQEDIGRHQPIRRVCVGVF